MAQTVNNLPAMQETWIRSLSWEDTLEEGVAIHSSIVAWEVSWTEEPGGPQSRVTKCQIRLTDQHFHFLIRDVIRYFSSVCLPSLGMTIPRSIHVAGNGIILFFLMAE